MEPFLVPRGSSFLPQNIVCSTPSFQLPVQGKQLFGKIQPELCTKPLTGECVTSYSQEHDTNAPKEEQQSKTKEVVQNLQRNENMDTSTEIKEESPLNDELFYDKQETEQNTFVGSSSTTDSVVNNLKPTLAYQNQDKDGCTEMTTEQNTNPFICILPLDDKSQTPIIKNSGDSKSPFIPLGSLGCEIDIDSVTSISNLSTRNTSGLPGDKLTTDNTDLQQLLKTNNVTDNNDSTKLIIDSDCSWVGREHHLEELNKGIDRTRLQKDLKELYELQPLPNPLIWNFYHDLQKASSPYERLRIMVQDMKLEIRRCLMNDTTALDRFKRKLNFLTYLVRKLKMFTGKYKEGEREKQTQVEDVEED